MIRLLILICIFLAIYPYIGAGFDQFTKDVNISAVGDILKSLTEFVKQTIDKFKS